MITKAEVEAMRRTEVETENEEAIAQAQNIARLEQSLGVPKIDYSLRPPTGGVAADVRAAYESVTGRAKAVDAAAKSIGQVRLYAKLIADDPSMSDDFARSIVKYMHFLITKSEISH